MLRVYGVNASPFVRSVRGCLDNAVADVEEQGGRTLRPQHPIGPYGYPMLVLDSEGNRVALHSPERAGRRQTTGWSQRFRRVRHAFCGL